MAKLHSEKTEKLCIYEEQSLVGSTPEPKLKCQRN